ncbi:MAG TPA: hypothetical protein VMB23_10685, partial [Spirochaetia bacterium]|nr:hypothetical protein [Spirochaetia bacterium]
MKYPPNPTSPVAGVVYVRDPIGRVLPVVDVTHPSFALDPDPGLWDRLVAAYEADLARRSQTPGWIQKLVLALVLRRSVLASGMRRGRATYLGGLDTYLFKVGPQFLDPVWSVPIDRVIASTVSGVSVRWRLDDVAGLTSRGLAAAAAQTVEPLVHLNLAGGPGSDSWNALLLLAKEHAGVLAGRPIRVEVLDRDP